jgi:acyl carrier protein
MTDTLNAQAISSYLSEHAGISGEINPDTDLLAEGALDSLLIMELVGELERRFDVSLQPGEITPANFRTPNALAELIDRKSRAVPVS